MESRIDYKRKKIECKFGLNDKRRKKWDQDRNTNYAHNNIYETMENTMGTMGLY